MIAYIVTSGLLLSVFYAFFMLLMVVSQDYQILFPGERRAISV